MDATIKEIKENKSHDNIEEKLNTLQKSYNTVDKI